MPTDDLEMLKNAARCFAHAQTCLEIADRLEGEDQRRLFEMAQEWNAFAAILMESKDEPSANPRAN